MNRPLTAAVVLAILCALVAAQSTKPAGDFADEAQVRGYWKDRATGLMWAGKDNGKDVNWKKATKYCRDLRLGGYSDWRLATIEELQGIYDKNAEAPGLVGPSKKQEPGTWHVKGNLFLTGYHWSADRITDERGRPTGYESYFDFHEGRSDHQPSGLLYPYSFMRALCVREYRG